MLIAPAMFTASLATGWEAISKVSLGLYLLAAFLATMAMGLVVVLGLVHTLSVHADAMRVIWSLRGGQIHPWAGRRVHGVVLTALFLVHVAVSAPFFCACLIFWPPSVFE